MPLYSLTAYSNFDLARAATSMGGSCQFCADGPHVSERARGMFTCFAVVGPPRALGMIPMG